MDKYKDILKILQDTFKEINTSVIDFLPKVLLAIVILIIGWYIAKILRDLIKKIIAKIGLDDILRKLDLEKFLKKAGYRLNSGRFLGETARWLVFIGFFVTVLDILELDQIQLFAYDILQNVGRIAVAMIIFVVAVVVARFVKNIASATAKAMKVESDKLIGSLAAFMVYLLATVTILGLFPIFGNMVRYIDLVVMGVIFAISLASGLAFGIGGKEKAKDILEKMKR